MAEFVFLFHNGDPSSWSPQQMQDHMQQWMAWSKTLTESGKLKGGNALEDEGRALKGPDKTLTDGPYTEAKDLIGGFMLIEAANLDEACKLAQGCPIFEQNGGVEVRPVRDMSGGGG